MDHLLLPMNPVPARIEVPYLCKEEYQGPFESFPERHGWGNGRLHKRKLNAEEIEELKYVLQTWLFFGLLEEVFGEQRASDWTSKVSNGCGYDVISTSHLRSQLTGLHKRLERISADSRQSRRRHIDNCLEITIDVLNMLSLQDSPLIDSEETLPIAFLCDLIEKNFGTDRDAYRAAGRWHLGVSRPLQARMLRDGWCKNDVHRLSNQLDLSSLYLASNLDRPEPQVCHQDCSTRLCVKSQVDEGKYISRHDTMNCDGKCEHVSVSQDELVSILQSGFVPLIFYDADDAPATIKLVPAALDISYVAISHVWSHGLGNPHENSLPQCQMRRLSGLAKDLYDNSDRKQVLFWLDTICFPVHSPEAADLAITFMRKTYADADRVLVLDRYLEAVESRPLLRTECLIRILCSSWTRRLWTLQEGALAKSLYFQFADQAIDIKNAAFMMTTEMTFWTRDRSLEHQPILSMISELWEVWRTVDSELPRIVLNYLSAGLRWRATSVASDEALCLTTLAGLDMGKVMEATPEDRMMKFWSLLPSVSAQTVFWSGSRIDHKGFHWAPATFLKEPEAIFQDFANKSFSEVNDKTSTTHTDSGLVFCCAGVLLNTWRANIGPNLWMRDENKNWYRLRRQHPIMLEPRVDENPIMPRTLCLIMKNTLEQSFAGPVSERSITCVIASIYDVDEDRDIIYANTEDIAYLIPMGNEISFSNEAPLIARLVTQSEGRLGFPGSEDAPVESRDLNQAVNKTQHAPMAGEETRIPKETFEILDEALAQVESPAGISEILSESQDFIPTRVKTRDEGGRLSIDNDGEHFLLDGVELSEDQTWCLD